MKKFLAYNRKQQKVLEELSDLWQHLDTPTETTAWIISETAERAAKLGLSDLYKKSLDLKGNFQDCRWYLSECLNTIPTASDAPLMTVDEIIAYLRLDADDRKPLDRLRNLIRRQGLPVIHRGRLLLFRRSAIDEWLQGKSGIILKDGSRARVRQNVNPRRVKI